jgi:creatinine amidohydrolase
MTTTLPHGLWQDLTTTDFARVDPQRTVALLPVAAIEQHGPHLPLSTDAEINRGIVDAAMRRLPSGASVLVLPALVVGDSLEHSAFPGTLSAELEPLLALWLAVGRGVARAGVRKLVIFNSHGGQRAHVDLAALRLRVAHGLLVARAHSFSFGVPPGLFAADELAHGLHGGAVETSLMLHLRPELVRREALADFASAWRVPADPAAPFAPAAPAAPSAASMAGRLLSAEKPVGIGWMAQDLHPSGACGDASAANAEHGRRLLDHLADMLVRLLAEVEAAPLPAP